MDRERLVALEDRAVMAADLYCGLGGWTEGFLAEGYDVIGFDIERHDYGTGGYPGQLVLQDVCTIHGAQLRDAAVIVASPPCQEFSYRAMPWKRAKALPPPYLGMKLFWQCWRIQQEACEASGRYIPLVVENVCGAQRWVGKAAWHYGSYYLWGDVPALMPTTLSIKNAHIGGGSWFKERNGERVEGNDPRDAHLKVPGFRFYGSGRSFQTASVKMQTVGAGEQYGGGFGWDGSAMRTGNSHSSARKAASAQIAKIPFPLARHIAQCFRQEVAA